MQPKCLPARDLCQTNTYWGGQVQHKDSFRPNMGFEFSPRCVQQLKSIDEHSIHFYQTLFPSFGKTKGKFHLIEENFLDPLTFEAAMHDPRCSQNLTMKSPPPVHTNNPLASDANSSQTRPPCGWKTDIFRRKSIISILAHLLKFSSIESQSSIRC